METVKKKDEREVEALEEGEDSSQMGGKRNRESRAS